MSLKIDLDHLKSFTKTLEGKALKTASRGKVFHANVLANGFEFIPSSSGKYRKEPYVNSIKVIARFNEMRSLQPKDYQDITRNSVYLLFLIKAYLE